MQKTVFSVDQEVVYPLQGVGKIEKIEKRLFKGEEVSYYVIYLEGADMTIMAPVDKTDDLGIRAIVHKKESEKALKQISQEPEAATGDWKVRYQTNLDLLKKGTICDIATVVTQLYHRSKVKELPILERKLYENALKLLTDELSCSLAKGKKEIEEMVFVRLESQT